MTFWSIRSGAPVRITLTLGLGAQGPVDSLCQALGIGVDHVLLVHFDGLERIVNSEGGVTLDLPAPVRDAMSNLMISHAGRKRLDGEEALAYIRARHIQELRNGHWVDEPPSVNERSDHALQVLVAVASRMDVSPTSVVSNIREVWAVAGAAEIDRGADIATLLNLLRRLQSGDWARAQLDVIVRGGGVPTADLVPDATQTLAAFDRGPRWMSVPAHSPSATGARRVKRISGAGQHSAPPTAAPPPVVIPAPAPPQVTPGVPTARPATTTTSTSITSTSSTTSSTSITSTTASVGNPAPPSAELRLDRPSVAPGGIVVAYGQGCVPGGLVSLSIDGTAAGNVVASADGTLTRPIQLQVGVRGTRSLPGAA